MNKTQKSAWFNLIGAILIIALGIHSFKIIARLISTGSISNPIQNLLLWVLPFLCWVIFGAIFLRKKQSPVEVKSDERDNLIKKRASLVAFVAVWVLLFASYLILWLLVGLSGTIPIFALPFIYLAVFYIVMFVWSVAVLIQYGRGGGNGK